MIINGSRVTADDRLGDGFTEYIVPTPYERSITPTIRIIISSVLGKKPLYKSVVIPFKMDLSRLREFQEHCIRKFCTNAPHHLPTAKIFGKIAIAYPHRQYVLYDTLPKDIYQA
jgi:hypothetical protein